MRFARNKGAIDIKRYEQYIIAKIAGPFLVITLGITGIAWLSQSLRFVDFIVNKGLSIGSFLYLSALILPSLFWVIIPLSTFISIVYAYNKLAGDSELVIFKSIGIDNLGLARPALIFCLLTTLISIGIAFYLLPASYREFKDMQNFIRNNYATVLLQEGVFVTPTKGLTVYIKDKDELGTLKGLLVYDSRNKTKRFTITAQEAVLENGPKGPMFILTNGSHQEYNRKTKQFSLLYFDRYNLELNLFNQEMLQKRWREPQERYLHELFYESVFANEKERYKLYSEGHFRITWPLYNILLGMIALIPFVKGEFSRRGGGKRIAKISIIAITFIVLALSIKNLTTKNMILNVLLYANVMMGIWATYYYLVKDKIKFKTKALPPYIKERLEASLNS